MRVFGGPVLVVDIEPETRTTQVNGPSVTRTETTRFSPGFAIGVSAF